jgi:phosphate transport system protein
MIHLTRHKKSAVETAVHLLAVAKALERVGDHATNVCEQLVFLVEGRDIRHVRELPDQ